VWVNVLALAACDRLEVKGDFTAEDALLDRLALVLDELELVQDEPGLTRMKLKTCVLEPGRWRRLLRERTGLDVQDNQAARLLADIQNFGAWLQQREGRDLSDEVVAHGDVGAANRFADVIGRAKDELVTPEEYMAFAHTRREAFEMKHGAGTFEEIVGSPSPVFGSLG
jgi:hypothetical protein